MRTDDEPISEHAASPGTYPKVLPTDVEAAIASELYFTAADAAQGVSHIPDTTIGWQSLELLTICILTLRNGFTVIGSSACASPENFDAAYGRKLARAKAAEQIWTLLGYMLREQLHQASQTQAHPGVPVDDGQMSREDD